jgi:hypothetical protein
MRELHGVVAVGWGRMPNLKSAALLFDRFRIVRFNKSIFTRPDVTAFNADLKFLESHGMVEVLSNDDEWRALHQSFNDSEKAALEAAQPVRFFTTERSRIS